MIGERNQQRHRRLLAILLCFYGFVHLALLSFVSIIFLALIREGYYETRQLKTFGVVALTLLMVTAALLSAYALFRQRRWASKTVFLTCCLILIISFIVLSQISWPGLSINRIIFGVLYGGASVALFIYGLRFVLVQRRISGTEYRD